MLSLRSVTFFFSLNSSGGNTVARSCNFFCSSNSSGSNNVGRSYIQECDTLLGIKVKNKIYSQITKKLKIQIKRRNALTLNRNLRNII